MLPQGKKRIALLVSVAALLSIAALIAVIRSGPRVRILDPRFHVVAFKAIHAKKDKMYWGNTQVPFIVRLRIGRGNHETGNHPVGGILPPHFP